MALFGSFGNLITGGLSILGQQGGNLGQFGQLGASVLSPLVAASQAPVAAGPVVAMAGAVRSGKSMPLSPGGIMGSIGSGITRMTAPILVKIAETLGRRSMSLRQAVRIVRRLGKFMGPAAAAAAIGITTSELAELIVADSQRTRRRMNPANVTALRRSMRRITSFHRLCQKADSLRGRSTRRRSTAATARSGGQIVQVK